MSADECCICFYATANRISPCGHLMCKECILRWCHTTNTCPLCKNVVLSPCPMCDLKPTDEPSLYVKVCPDRMIGITLTDVRVGVRLKTVDRHSLAHRLGMRRGQIVTHVNDIPMTTPHDLIEMVYEARVRSHPLRFTFSSSPWSLRNILESVISCVVGSRAAIVPRGF